MIQSFGDRGTEDLFNGVNSSKARRIPSNIVDSALLKLDVLNAATSLNDLRSPPGNRLEALRGTLTGFHSIRINSQWRIIFRWSDSNCNEVRIVDYH